MKEEKILINNIETNFKIAGVGFPILILHGWGGSSDSWVRVQEILSQNNFQVICPDLPGFGKTQLPPNAWSSDDYITFILNFVEGIGLDKFYLIGHSFGGGLAVKFATLYSQKVESLILCDAAIIRNNKLNLRQKIASFLTKAEYNIFSVPFSEKTVYPWAKKLVYKIAGTSDYYLAKGTMKETFKNISGEDLTAFASQIKVPTLIIWGKQDKTLPLENGLTLNKIIPNSKLLIIDDVDHSPHRKKPEELAKDIINFFYGNIS